jgi:hypothetical protein
MTAMLGTSSELRNCHLATVDRNVVCRHKRTLIEWPSNCSGRIWLDADRLNIGSMKASSGFRSVE